MAFPPVAMRSRGCAVSPIVRRFWDCECVPGIEDLAAFNNPSQKTVIAFVVNILLRYFSSLAFGT